MSVNKLGAGLVACIISTILLAIQGQELPTNYEYYTEGGVLSGVTELPDGFQLNGKNITIHSGAMHYYRIHPSYWRDRLRKLRATGANAVETYVPWNLHEPSPGKYDFGDGSDDMSPFLNIITYIRIAQEEDLFVLVRPGPYICAEWEFGGMPSWLLRNPEIKIRSSDPKFMARVNFYFGQLLPLFVDLQFTNGGPIIAFQVENEYGNVKQGNEPIDQQYLIELHQSMKSFGLKEMFFTSDSPRNAGADESYIPSVLRTANFNSQPEANLDRLKQQQPNKPAMVMEYWTGWFDHWMESSHQVVPVEAYSDLLERILKYPSSVNLYMFHGGTNFGFLNGANIQDSSPFYRSTISSYDYDAPLSEAGDYTDKYLATKQLFDQYNPVKTKLPEQPLESVKVAYPSVTITGQLGFDSIVSQVPSTSQFQHYDVTNMEALDMNDGAGQSYGYILYRKPSVTFGQSSTLKISGKVTDIATVLIDGVAKTTPITSPDNITDFGYWVTSDAELQLDAASSGVRTLDIMVENFGRNNFGTLSDFDQRKGLWQGPVLVDGVELHNWEVVALEFRGTWINSLTGWVTMTSSSAPALYHATFSVTDPRDTFLDMRAWGKGVVFINGFNLGRYFNLGPTRTVYLPAPLLKIGLNQIVVFEHYSPSNQIVFTETPILGNAQVHAKFNQGV